MTFDTYNKCSFNCLYCFSYYQKSHNIGEGGTRVGQFDYQRKSPLLHVDVEKIKKLFHFESTGDGHKQFFPYIRQRIPMQWGGMADQFDENERKRGVTLEILRCLRALNYPLSFSTKAVWWLKDERYLKQFRGADNWNCKFSIINLDAGLARRMERGCPSPQDRIEAIRIYSRLNRGGATLRLRPFIIGLSDRNKEHLELIKQARAAGADAVSTEFFCLEARADERLRARYSAMSDILGFDVFDFYRRNSKGAGYRRLNYQLKHKYILEMKELCDRIGMRFYVSDAHHKAHCHNGSCCGLPASWNYSKGQFTEALLIAKKHGQVRFSDISGPMEMFKHFRWLTGEGFNTTSILLAAQRYRMSMYDYIREMWNTPDGARSPYKYFAGLLEPAGLDDCGDVIYKFNYARHEGKKNVVESENGAE